MIVFDLINDEAPLFAGAIEELVKEQTITKEDIIGIVEGRRWYKEVHGLSLKNRLLFFDKLDQKEINIKEELDRIAVMYNNFNIYACDRHLIGRKTAFQEKMLVYTYLFFEDIFSKGVTHYFTTGIAFAYNLISFQVSQRFGAKHVSFYGTRMGNRTAVSYSTNNSFDEVNESFTNFSPEKVTSEMHQPIREFVNKPVQPSYMKNAINASSVKTIFIKEFFIRFNRYYFKGRHKYDFFTGNPFKLSIFKLRKIINAKKIGFLHSSIFEEPEVSEKYFIFPLHMQPEASTLILAPFHVSQKNTIINISKVLPANIKLYVKEHKSALGQHTKQFYKELKNYPNIKMISYNQNMFELIKNSLGTINLSSTVGLESLFLKKPAIILGDVFYDATGLTFKISSYKELEELIKKVGKQDFSVDHYFAHYDEKLAYFIHCLETRSYPFEFNVAKLDTKERVLKPANISGMANCIKEQITK